MVIAVDIKAVNAIIDVISNATVNTRQGFVPISLNLRLVHVPLSQLLLNNLQQ